MPETLLIDARHMRPDLGVGTWDASVTERPRLQVPLVVDLDGTLVKTDLLHECLTEALLKRPLTCHRTVAWLARGRAHLKSRLAQDADLDVAALPYRDDLLRWLRQEKATGRRIVLATAQSKLFATKVAEHLGIFDEVMSSDDSVNLSSRAKRDALVQRFGARGFAYVGNSRADLPVWEAASDAHLAGHAPHLAHLLRRRGNLGKVFDEGIGSLDALLRAMRPAQWAKNTLLLLPLIAAHLIGDLESVSRALLAMAAFSLAASGVYILNDLIDLEDDRHHPRKRLRPFASGALPVLTGWAVWPLLMATALALAASTLGPAFVGWLTFYVALTLAYCLWIKRRPVADVITLALLYTIRVIAGAAAISVPLSFWLLAFSIFVFLSLALVKRYTELQSVCTDSQTLRGRGYGGRDLHYVAILGCGAAYTSVLVLAMYIQDPRTALLYASPQLIWPICPIFLFWISRVWLLASRGQMHDDPVVFAIKDPLTWLTVTLMLCSFGLASVVR